MKHWLKYLIIVALFTLTMPVLARSNYSYKTEPSQSKYSGTYINEEVDVPITQVGLPQKYTQPPVQEKGLEIVWNQWHAKVRNKISEDISNTLTPQNYIIAVMCTIDRNQNISDIVVLYFPRTTLKIVSGTAYLKNNAPFYIYSHTPRTYYKAYINTNELLTLGKLGKDEHEEVSTILRHSTLQKVAYSKIPYYRFFRQVASNMELRQGESSLRFPTSSRRNKVAVTGGVTDILSIQSVIQYTSDMFNDMEKF